MTDPRFLHRWCSVDTAAHVTSRSFCVPPPTFPGQVVGYYIFLNVNEIIIHNLNIKAN